MLALEVLDNLAHDKVVVRDGQPLQQAALSTPDERTPSRVVASCDWILAKFVTVREAPGWVELRRTEMFVARFLVVALLVDGVTDGPFSRPPP